MKKLLCTILILCMMPMYGITFHAQEDGLIDFFLSFSPIDESGIVTVSVNVAEHTGFCAFKLLLRYDNAILRPIPRSNKNNLYNGLLTINANNSGANLEIMSQYSVVGNSTATVSEAGELFSFQMQVLPNTQASTAITLNAPSYVSTIDYASMDILMEDAQLELLYPQTVVPADNGSVLLSADFAAYGEEITVSLLPAATYMPEGFLLDAMPTNGQSYIAQGMHTVQGMFTPSPLFSITGEEAENGTLSVSAEEAYWGEEIVLTASPNEHYTLSHFTVDGIPIDSDTFKVTGNHMVSAVFSPIFYSITTETPLGGSIALSDASGVFGDEIRIFPTPDEHFAFSYYTVDGEPIDGETFTISGNHTVGAVFSPIAYDIATEELAHGTVTIDKVQAIFDETITLHAEPEAHYMLEYFTLDGLPLEGSSFSVTGNHTVGASFVPVVYTVTATEASGGHFSVSAQNGIFGTEVYLTATPDMHYRFSHYLLDGEILDTNSFLVSQNHTIEAVFLPILYDISVSVPQHGLVHADYTQGEFSQTVTLSATPDEHYAFEYFTLDGAPIEGNTFTIAGNHVVSASFIPVVYVVTIAEMLGGRVDISANEGPVGTEISVSATPDENYTFSHFLLDGEVLETDIFTITKNHTISAVFTPIHAVTISVDVDGNGSVSGGGVYSIGSLVTLVATPASKYTFSGWYLGDKKLSTKKNYTFTAESNVEIEAIFQKKSGGGGGGGSFAPPTPAPPVVQTMGLRSQPSSIRFMTAQDGKFYPDRAATRYEVIEALHALFFVPETTNTASLSDVDASHKDIVSRFMASGVLHGYDDGSFRGDNPITRAELCKVLCVLLSMTDNKEASVFSDVSADFWGTPFITATASKGYVLGYEDGSFRPNNNITRAELTALLSRIAGTKTDAPHPALSDITSAHWAYDCVQMACKMQ